MKINKKIYTSLLLFSLLFPAVAQTPGGVGEPLLWNKFCHHHDSIALHGKGITFIGVGQVAKNDKEQTLWSIGTSNNTSFLQTTSRTADLKKDAFMNYGNDTLPELRMYSYCNSSQDTSGKNLYIGHATKKGLPSIDLKNPYKEFVVYERALSSQELNRVESALALSHGLTLRHSYLNSDGIIIWNYISKKAYSHHIGGIIVDSISGLNRKKGFNAENGNFILVNYPLLKDKQSLIWGDDNKSLRFINNKTYGKWLQRNWKISATNMNGAEVDVAADSRAFQQISPLTDGENYWLAVDPSGTGKFSVRNVKYYKADRFIDDSIRFHGVVINDNSVWSLRAGKNMFTTIQVEQTEDEKHVNGTLDILITGGIAPYGNVLKKDDAIIYDYATNDTIVTIQSLSEGYYSLSTTDKMGVIDTKEFEITATGIKEISGDDDFSQSDDKIRKITVSPNPTRDGYVSIEIEKNENSPVTLTLHTAGGAVVSSKSFSADDYLFTRMYLPVEGVYLLKVECGNESRTLKLIRK